MRASPRRARTSRAAALPQILSCTRSPRQHQTRALPLDNVKARDDRRRLHALLCGISRRILRTARTAGAALLSGAYRYDHLRATSLQRIAYARNQISALAKKRILA